MKKEKGKEDLPVVPKSAEGKETGESFEQIPRLYTLEQLSAKTGLSLHQLRQAIRSGDLVAVKNGEEYRITGEDLNGFLRKRRAKV